MSREEKSLVECNEIKYRSVDEKIEVESGGEEIRKKLSEKKKKKNKKKNK